MIPLRVSLEGFLSYKDKQVIDFENSSLWMLWGPNGVGKSAIFDAITFALYSSHRGGKSNAKELINHYSNRLVVEFDFLVDGVAYRVRRVLPHKGRPVREVVLLSKDANRPDCVHEMPVPNTDSDESFKDWVRRTIGLDERAFTSSILLLQGKSEQLLTVEPKDRYTILAELIDLSRYQMLHDAADAHRKNYDSQVKTLSRQLEAPAIQTVTVESIEVAKSEVTQKNEQWRIAQVEVECFTQLLEQAKRWEELVAELQEKQAALQNALVLIAREDEIESNFQEWQTLQQVLPTLKQVVEQRQHIAESQWHARTLQDTIDTLSALVLDTQSKRNVATEQVHQLDHTIEHVQREKEQRQRRLPKLASIVVKLDQVESLREQIAQLQAQISTFLPNITERLQEAEERAEQLAKTGRALPWLQAFAHERSELAKALTEAENAYTPAEILLAQLKEYQVKRGHLNTQLLEAQKTEKYLLAEQAGASARYEDACKKLERFEDAVAQQFCELCGQKITEEHAEQEKTRLRQQIEETGRIYEEQESLHQRAVDLQQRIEAEIAALVVQIENVTKEHRQYEDQERDHQNRAVSHIRQIRRAFDNIQSPFREQIINVVPAEDIGWLETTYPTKADLQTLQDEIDGKAAHESNVKQFRKEYHEWQSIQTQREFADKQISQLLASFDPVQASRDRDEKNRIDQELECLETESSQLREFHKQAEKHLQEAIENYEKFRKEEQEQRTKLAAEYARQETLSRTLRSLIAVLPAFWQARAESISADELAHLEQKCNLLASYELQYEQLGYARKDKATNEQRINELREQIDKYSPEASHSADEVARELDCKKVAQGQADEERNQAWQSLTHLKAQWEYRMNLEQQKRESERFYHLYKLLTDLLGRGGLQLHLLREAENVITDLANGTLGGLSHGRMRLELRRDSEVSRTSTEKALDLLVYDRDTGQHAIPINHASGSQKFRMAVSLALAIGRYSNRAAHHIESVIIDEGFGSLDKAGRDDMIQELHTLGQQLARIILVSHQDDFATAFPNRYSFKLVDKASCVTLVGDD